MRHNQALANKQHDRQSLKDLQDAMLSWRTDNALTPTTRA